MTDNGWVIHVCNNPEKDWIERLNLEMTDDIVTRLRNAEAPKDGSELLCDLADEAADEIERLRKLVVLCPKCYEAEHGVGRWEQEVHGE